MKNLLIIAILLQCAFLSSAQKLIIELPEPESQKGNLMVGVYTSNDDFPSVPSITQKITVQGNFKKILDMDLSAGTYAVSVYHDLNENGKLDRNIVGIPKEPVAFSNIDRLRMGPPKFKDASFSLNGTKKVELKWLDGI